MYYHNFLVNLEFGKLRDIFINRITKPTLRQSKNLHLKKKFPSTILLINNSLIIITKIEDYFYHSIFILTIPL